ncbi:DUF5689 domain-containing protein [Tenacibaculum pacificus]|uniref:DUF5689 domain-containing protein n=1 Tax=Tenacibaculum pacificus TaxID=3018314 RepID=UPI0022F3A22A|nr:DUF5689 domain-containing protein [Tenacibaculum pacificus]WBX73876.1 DUF5689 domain-containing protein [Tenacibaculum pacificus]
MLSFLSCVEDGEFELPILGAEKEYKNLKSLTEIASLYQGSLIEIKEDITTSAYVTSNDREGNFFKSIFIQDAFENPKIGFEIKINDTNLHARYTVGRKIFIKIKGLFLNKNKDGSYQIGDRNTFGNAIDRIGVNDYVNFIDRASEIATITPLPLKISELSEKHQNILIKINKVQSEIKGLQYAWPKAGSSIYFVDRMLVSCESSEKIIFRNSIFSTFKGLFIPDKKGAITGVFTIVESEKMVMIRDTKDINFTEDYGCFNNPTLASLSDVKNLFTQDETLISENLKIKVVVTSDSSKGNISTKNAFAQDASAGILLNFTDTHNLNLGDEIEIAVGELSLTKQNGLLQLNLTSKNIVTKTTGILPLAELITIEQALSGNYESKLVKIEDVQFKNITKNYLGLNTLTSDCDNELKISSIETTAIFSNNQVNDKKGTITGIMTQNNEVFIHIRDESDIDFNENYECTSVDNNPISNDLFFSEYAEGSSSNKYIEIYNGTGEVVDLSNYKVELYINGSTVSSKNIFLNTLSNTLLDKEDVFVIYHTKASNFIKSEGDINASVAFFNGDDAVVLKHNDIIIDVIGLVGEDPGTAWEVAGISNATQNHTLIRKSSVIKGNTTWNISAGTNISNSEWEVKDQDYFSSVGKK